MQTYIGVKLIHAEPEMKDGKLGYKVQYEDGYTSWSPKEAFEKAYLPINLDHKLTEEDINRFMLAADVKSEKMSDKLTVVACELPTGWIEVEGSACVDPKNYNQALGEKYCLARIKSRMWQYLGFVLQWAKHGLKG